MVMTADELKRQVFPGESGGDYGALFGYSNRPGRTFGNVDLTRMTVNQAIEFSNPRGPYGQWVKDQIGRVATPMGAYQIVGTTLRAAKEGLGLSGNEVMTPELQDRLGMWIYGQQGPGAWEAWGRGGSSQPRSSAQTSSQGAPMAGLMDTGRVSAQNTPSAGLMGMSPEPQGFRERLMRDVRSGDFADNLTLAINSLRMRPDQGLADMVMQRQEQRAQERQANRTAEWLASIGRTDLAEAIGSGALDARSAAVIAMTPQAAQEQTAAMQNYEFLRAQGVDDQTAMERSFGAGGTTVQNIMPGDDAFAGAFAKSDADAFAAVSSVGLNAQGQINQLVELENLLATAPQGAPGALVQFAGRLGIATEGLDEVQAAQAVMNRLTLQQRPPGSGPMTDRDLEFLMRSVPQIINQPGGNQLIIETMRRVAEYDIQGAQIVQALRAGEIDRAQAMEMLMSRENPLEGFQAPEGQPATSAPGLQRPSSVPQSAWDEMTDEEKQLAIRLAGGVR